MNFYIFFIHILYLFYFSVFTGRQANGDESRMTLQMRVSRRNQMIATSDYNRQLEKAESKAIVTVFSLDANHFECT